MAPEHEEASAPLQVEDTTQDAQPARDASERTGAPDRAVTIRGRIVNLHHTLRPGDLTLTAMMHGEELERALAEHGQVVAKNVRVAWPDAVFEHATSLNSISFELHASRGNRGTESVAQVVWSRSADDAGTLLTMDAGRYYPESGREIEVVVTYSKELYKRTAARAALIGVPPDEMRLFGAVLSGWKTLRCADRPLLNSKCSSSFVVSGADSGPFDIAVRNSLTGNSYIYNDVVADAANTVQLHLPDGGSIRCSFDGVPDAVLNALKRGSEPMLIVYDSDGFCCCSAWLGDPEFRGKSSVVVRGLKDGIYTCVAAAGNEWMSVPITVSSRNFGS